MMGIMPSLVKRSLRVVGPTGTGVDSLYAVHPTNDFCVVEMARAAGLPLVQQSLDPRHTTSFGVGQVLVDAAKTGAKKIYLGLGGSGTNDMGIPALQAMSIVRARIGEQWFDHTGPPLTGGMLAYVDAFEVNAEAAKKFPPIILISAVTNPLLGPTGATEIYGPQKGATTPEIRRDLEDGLTRVADWIDVLMPDVKIRSMKGGGAAGGMAAGFHALAGASWQPGAVSFSEMCGLREHINWADVVFTGEGRFDSQTTEHGKTISVVLQLCKELKKPLVVVCGQVKDRQTITAAGGLPMVVSLVPMFSVADAMSMPAPCVTAALRNQMSAVMTYAQQSPKAKM
jgi:glycerate kinase